MRWDNLFDDLESQLEQQLTAEDLDLQAEEERLRLARLSVRDRLRVLVRSGSSEDRVVRLVLADASRVSIEPSTFGRDWLAAELVEDSGRRPQCVLPLDAIDAILFTRDQVMQSLDDSSGAEAPNALSARLGLAFVLRDLCRRRQPVELRVRDGRMHGSTAWVAITSTSPFTNRELHGGNPP
jgi:hypothetical protein